MNQHQGNIYLSVMNACKDYKYGEP